MRFDKRLLTSLWVVMMLCTSGLTSCYGQSKLYAYGGLSNVFGTGTNIIIGSDFSFKFNYLSADLEYERRVIGSFSFLTGASVFQAGYNATDGTFSSTSEFKATYIAIPLMARWNVGNKNFYYLDFGFDPYYLAKAHLSESLQNINGLTTTVSGNIEKYSNRFYYAAKFQFVFLVNRFSFGLYLILPAKGQSTLKNLENNWGLNSQQSTYLLSNGFSDYRITGLKVGFRIK